MPKSKKWRPPWGWILALIQQIMGNKEKIADRAAAATAAGQAQPRTAPPPVQPSPMAGMQSEVTPRLPTTGAAGTGAAGVGAGMGATAASPSTATTPLQPRPTPNPAGNQYEGMSGKQFDTALANRGYSVGGSGGGGSSGFDWQKLMGAGMQNRPQIQGTATPGTPGQQVQTPQMPLTSAMPVARQASAEGALPWWYLMSRAR